MNRVLHKWLPRLFYKKFDGGVSSGVTGYFLIEWKILFSIGILHFKKGSRENYHSHAFNAITWFVKGRVTEEKYQGRIRNYAASLLPKFTPRSNVHRVVSHLDTWALTLRGPWSDTWYEVTPYGDVVTLTHGRQVVGLIQKGRQ